ncbi:TPA: ATP-dependent DNA helicase PcrA [Candidatus Giovannonibacteria bacterium]|nr:ATP-dependent DNA helicase PcrA [Candidatus Giovannonibacteria bacterium]
MSMEFSLNQAQERAVLTADGPVLIVAGAGSGKTMVLAHRIAHLIEKGVKADQILAITFTNKAAEEMRNRINSLIPNSQFPIPKPWVGTFHSFSAFVLRQSGRAIGVGKTFSIVDEEDSLALVKEALADLELDPKKFEPRKLRALISRKKNEMEGRENFNQSYFEKILVRVWEKYEEKLEKAKALDFDDLLLKTVELFSKHPGILEEWQERFRYLHVDEYQDTNLVQYHLAKLLAQKYRNICVVGDIDQAIYSWRGADFRNILHFERDWPEAKIITLEENYRSTQLILDAANAVIVKNKSRVPKNLFSQKKSGPKITLFESVSEEEEASFIAALSKTLVRDGKIPPREIAVLYRTNFQSRILEEKMLEENIPYQVVGVKFYERKEIKDTLAYLKASLNSEDLLSVKRIINFPPRGIGKALLTKFLAGEKLRQAEEFIKITSEIKDAIETKNASEAVKSVIQKSGLEDYLQDGTEESEMRLSNIKELVTLARRYDEAKPPEGILKLLEDAALMSEQDTMKKEENSVKLMTVHAAKGLEFKMVFIAGLEEGLFPHRAISREDEELRQEEERRLFYVALTRAKEKIYLSYAVFRTIFGERRINLPSSFLLDIPEEFLERAPDKIITLES